MNEATLDRLREVGLRDDSVVQLDFFFFAPDVKSARSLKAHLERNECLDVEVIKQGWFLWRSFAVEGKSHPTTLSIELLSEWVTWMTVQGVVHNCEFDGWGTEVPAS